MHTYIHTYIHLYVYICIYTNIYIYIYIYGFFQESFYNKRFGDVLFVQVLKNRQLCCINDFSFKLKKTMWYKLMDWFVPLSRVLFIVARIVW